MSVKYYKYQTKFSGIRYFKVDNSNPHVVQNVFTPRVKKKGKIHNIGLTLIKHETFKSNYEIALKDGRWIKEVRKSEWDKAFNETLNKMTKW